MSILKFAYVRGAQNALVSAGAIEPYANEYQADLAVKLAAMAIEDDAADQVDDEELAAAMASLASNAENELSPEEQAMLMQEAMEGKSELEEAMESDEETAREVVAYLKQAASAHFQGGVANPKPVNPGDYEHDAGARSNEGYAHLNGAQGLADPHKNATPFTAAQKPHVEGATLDAKTAAAILRKLSTDAANTAANELGGAGLGGTDEEHEGGPRKSDSYANLASQGLETGKSNATPYTGKMVNHTDNMAASTAALSGSDKSAAYNFLLYKTAEEVGPFLPSSLTETDKLAALRTMIGMTQPERAQYIQRIKWAMDDSEEERDEDDDKENKSEGLTEGQKKLPPELREAIAKKKKDDDDAEKEASYILRQLGLGY
tara:strand:- start:2706 stop:3833 length:1128 start_codon:yes stop_codon:yes gene_type:complete